MSKYEFMARLEALLSELPYEERMEALRYYDEYISGEGIEREQDIVKELGSPEGIAKSIKANLYEEGAAESAEYTETGYHNPVYEEEKEVPTGYEGAAKNDRTQEQYQDNFNTRYHNPYEKEVARPREGKYSMSKVILIAILCVIGLPAILGVAGGLFGVIMGILGALFAIVVGVAGASVGLYVSAVALFIAGIAKVGIMPAQGILYMGGSMLLVALGSLFLILTVLICGRFIPFLFRLVISLIQKLFRRKEQLA